MTIFSKTNLQIHSDLGEEEKNIHTWSCPRSGNHDNTRGRSVAPRFGVCGREARCVRVGVKGQTVALGAGQLHQGQIVTSALTLVLPVNHHPLRSERPLRRPDAHHVPGRIAAEPGGERERDEAPGGFIPVSVSWCR